jgi:ribonuclease P protein component
MKKNLTKKERISGKDISKIFEISNSTKYSCIKLLFCRNEKKWNRIAVVLKKGYGNSVERNHAKRIVKEIYRKIKIYLPEGHDFIFLLLNKIENYVDAKQIIVSLFRQAGIANVSEKYI